MIKYKDSMIKIRFTDMIGFDRVPRIKKLLESKGILVCSIESKLNYSKSEEWFCVHSDRESLMLCKLLYGNVSSGLYEDLING